MPKFKKRKEAKGVFSNIFNGVQNVDKVAGIILKLQRELPQMDLARGAIIVRPMELFSDGTYKMQDFKCEKTEKGSFMVRAIQGHKLCTDLWCLSNDDLGLIGFCNKPMDSEKIIAFEVEYITSGKKKMMFLTPIEGTEEQLRHYYSVEDSKVKDEKPEVECGV